MCLHTYSEPFCANYTFLYTFETPPVLPTNLLHFRTVLYTYVCIICILSEAANDANERFAATIHLIVTILM